MFGTISDNLASFSGNGFITALLAASLVFLGFRLKKSPEKTMTVWFPLYVLLVYFCPVWYIYISLREDAEILYRVLWMLPFGVITCFAIVQVIFLLPKKNRTVAFAVAILLIALSGQYIYSNPQFKKAENVYHIPQTVVDICDDLKVEGREIRVCMPLEFVQYTRQYCSNICLTYGRAVLVNTGVDLTSDILDYLEKDIVDVPYVAGELKRTLTHYIVISHEKELSESFEKYNFGYVKTIDGYDIYLDNDAYLGTDF